MKHLHTFIYECINLNEGGNAVTCKRLSADEAEKTFLDVEKNVLPLLGLKSDGGDYCTLGSFLKKKDGDTYGDIDIAVSSDAIAANNGISLDEVEQRITEILDKFGHEYKWSKGIHVISAAWPIPGNETEFAQVDFMPVTNLDFSKWMYHSPDFRKAESKYKGLYRNIIIMCICSLCGRKTLSTFDDGQVAEFETYTLRLNSGLARVRKSFVGARGNMLKNAKSLKEYERFVTDNPQEIIDVAFGEGHDANDFNTFEDCYKFFMSDAFPHKSIREDVVKKVLENLKGVAPVPSEFYDDWGTICDMYAEN